MPTLKPRPGTALVRPVTTDTKLPGSRIHLLDDTVKRMAAQQMELVAMGAPPERDDPEPHDTDVDALLQSLPTNSWLLVQPWSSVEADRGRFLIQQSAILAVLR